MTAVSASTGYLVFDLALRLTLLDLLLRPVGDWTVRPFVLALAAIALLRTNWLRHPLLWLVLATLTAVRVIVDWPLADNHAYLLSYWCLAAALALFAKNPGRVLARSGRWLIGLVFLFACVWKLTVSDNYVDGTFFQVTMITDDRFAGFSRIAGGLDDENYAVLREAVTQHLDAPPGHQTSMPEVPPRFRYLALAATGWNLFINAALAILFLWPSGSRVRTLRHLALLTYCVVTYAIATVDGFGWLLLAMGAAQTRLEQVRLRRAYIGVFMLILLYREIPWADKVFLPLIGQ
ncbi:MAG: hypothetical protein ACR2QU_06580 [Gammaproteobacteria bacterium]